MTDKIRNLIPESIDISTKNLLDPITKETGNAIGDKVTLVLHNHKGKIKGRKIS